MPSVPLSRNRDLLETARPGSTLLGEQGPSVQGEAAPAGQCRSAPLERRNGRRSAGAWQCRPRLAQGHALSAHDRAPRTLQLRGRGGRLPLPEGQLCGDHVGPAPPGAAAGDHKAAPGYRRRPGPPGIGERAQTARGRRFRPPAVRETAQTARAQGHVGGAGACPPHPREEAGMGGRGRQRGLP